MSTPEKSIAKGTNIKNNPVAIKPRFAFRTNED